MTRKCKFCGKEFTPIQNHQVYCSRSCANRQYRKNYKLKHGFIPFSQKSEAERMRVCPHCKKSFVAHTPSQKYCCGQCKRDEYKKNKTFKDSAAKILCERKSVKPKHESLSKRHIKHVSHIDDDNAKARALGMSYGKYKALARIQALHDDFQRRSWS